MEPAIIISIALGGLAGLVLLIGIIVCAVRFSRRKKGIEYPTDKEGDHAQQYDQTLVAPGHLPPPGEWVTSESGVISNLAAPSVTLVDSGPGPEEVQHLNSTSESVILNPAALENATVVSIPSGGNQERQTLNETPSTSTSAQPQAVLSMNNGQDGRSVLNNINSQVVPGPIVPQQASLLYPQLPAPAPAFQAPNPMMPLVPNGVYLPQPGPQPLITPGYMTAGGPGSLVLSNQAFPSPAQNLSAVAGSQVTGIVPYGGVETTGIRPSPGPLTSGIRPAPGPQGTHVNSDGFTVVPTRQATNAAI